MADTIVGLMTAGCVLPYIRDIRRGTTVPQRMSWITFAGLSTAATAAQFADHGATSGVFLTGGAALGFGTVAMLSIHNGVGGARAFDRVALVGLAVVLLLWTRLDNDTLIVCMIAAIEIPAVAATAVKAWNEPTSETRSTWLIDGSAGLLALAAAERPTFALLAYPAYHSVANLSVVAAITGGSRRADR